MSAVNFAPPPSMSGLTAPVASAEPRLTLLEFLHSPHASNMVKGALLGGLTMLDLQGLGGPEIRSVLSALRKDANHEALWTVFGDATSVHLPLGVHANAAVLDEFASEKIELSVWQDIAGQVASTLHREDPEVAGVAEHLLADIYNTK